MIDFQNGTFVKLKLAQNAFDGMIQPLLIDGEQILGSFKGIRDGVVLTNKRIIAINVQGMTGKKKDFSSLPYSRVQAFSVESAGMMDLDSELELWFSGLGKVRFEFCDGIDINVIGKLISEKVL